jgi:hypothetical protein
MESRFCDAVRKAVREILSQANSTIRTAEEIGHPRFIGYIQQLKGKVQQTNEALAYCSGESCTDEKECVWLEGKYGHKLTVEVDILVLHIFKKQLTSNVEE